MTEMTPLERPANNEAVARFETGMMLKRAQGHNHTRLFSISTITVTRNFLNRLKEKVENTKSGTEINRHTEKVEDCQRGLSCHAAFPNTEFTCCF